MSSPAPAARRWRIGGRVQGVGYRPYVYRLAHSLQLTGWVRNSAGAVEVHAQGAVDRLVVFGRALLENPPPPALARLMGLELVPVESCDAFVILDSIVGGAQQLTVPWDLSPCAQCLEELHDPTGRRYRYPFINCAQCGPRYSIIRALPYDRCNTTLDTFVLCPGCAAEYADPLDRRFHAQPLACGLCGPTIRWQGAGWDVRGERDLRGERALRVVIEALRAGRIVAVRGVGGYHLLCDATDPLAVERLRVRKGRPAKPLAVMVPWEGADGLDSARRMARLSALAAKLLCDAARPIVVVPLLAGGTLCADVAPGLRDVGLMLPYSPLHELLLEGFGGALVATSGNCNGEPVLTLPEEAEDRLSRIADGFLHHDRPIARPAEDAVVRIIGGLARPVRLGRGTAPLEFELTRPIRVPTLGVGAHSKCCIALAWGRRVIVSPHVGDLSTPRGCQLFAQVIADLQDLYGVRAERVAHDAHAQYASSRWARDSGLPTLRVWHHHAHANAVVGEYAVQGPILCFTWDAVGLGCDGTLWGGEALLGEPGAWRRVASFRTFRALGGDRAALEPWRSALALCWDAGVAWPEGDARGGTLLRQAYDAGVNSPTSSAVGRLFDAAASLTGICHLASYEGEGPMRLEAASGAYAAGGRDATPVTLSLARDAFGVWRSDWRPLLHAMQDQRYSPGFRGAQFHASLAQALRDQALAVRTDSGINRVGLAGGVFQNCILTEAATALLAEAGFEVLIPHRLPLNDAAIGFGQIVEATRRAA